MGCLLCCFQVREPDVDQEQEGPDDDDGQQVQQPNVTINRNTEAGLSSLVQDIAVECDPLLGKGAKDVNLSQVKPELVLGSDKLIPEKSENYVVSRDDECPICFEEYTNDNPRITTQCLHHYHLGCILDWQERSEFCPVCSRVMVIEEIK